MSRRGGGRRGGGRAGNEGLYRESQPPAPSYGRGRGREGSQRGRGGPAPQYHAPPPPTPSVPATTPVMSASAPQSSLTRQVERLSLAETRPETVTPGASSSVVPAPVAAPPQSSKSIGFPRRPGFGTVGRKCVVRANHFLVEVADKDICHYDVRTISYFPFLLFLLISLPSLSHDLR
jgi:eukaryotic translation initiation factor 2C